MNAIHSSVVLKKYNIDIALRLFLTLPVTGAIFEGSSSNLKLIQKMIRSSMSQNRLSGLAMILIKQDAASCIDYDDIIDTLACATTRKVVQ